MPLFKHNHNPAVQQPSAGAGNPAGIASGNYANEPSYSDGATAAGRRSDYTHLGNTGSVPPRTTGGAGLAGVGTAAGSGGGLGHNTEAGYAAGPGMGTGQGFNEAPVGQPQTATGPLPPTGVGAGQPSATAGGMRTGGTGTGSGSLTGKVEHVVGTLIGSESLKAKGIAKEREAAQLKAQATELNAAERFEQEALARRERAVAHGAHPDHRHLGGPQLNDAGISSGHTHVGVTGSTNVGGTSGNVPGDMRSGTY